MLPVIAASLEGRLDPQTGKWVLNVIAKDALPRWAGYPERKDFKKYLKHANDTLKKRTAYILKPRPAGISPEKSQAQNAKAIAQALAMNEINTKYDTGYDIVVRP